MVHFAPSSLITIMLMLMPSALAASQLLRRTNTLNNHYGEAKDTVLSYNPDPNVALETLQALLVNEGEQQLLSQLMSQGSSMSMPTTLPPISSCQSAYAYCGQGVSTCSLDGGWELDFSAMDLDSGFHLQCELRIGSGRCIEGANYDVSPDAPIGTFEITEEFLHTAVFSSLDVGMVDDIILVVTDAQGGPVRHLSSLGEHTEEVVEHLSSLEGQEEIVEQLSFLEGQEQVFLENAKHLYQDLDFQFEDYSITFGGEFSLEHVAFYATICPCAGDTCEWSNAPNNNDNVSPGATLEPITDVEPEAVFEPSAVPSAVPSASPSFSPSTSVEPTVSPSQSPTSSQSPSVAPTAAPTNAATRSRNGRNPNIILGGENNTTKNDKAAAAASLSVGSIVAIVAGCVVALVVAAMLIAHRKSANSSESSLP